MASINSFTHLENNIEFWFCILIRVLTTSYVLKVDKSGYVKNSNELFTFEKKKLRTNDSYLQIIVGDQ